MCVLEGLSESTAGQGQKGWAGYATLGGKRRRKKSPWAQTTQYMQTP